MSFWSAIKGTTESIFKIGINRASIDASGLSAARSFSLPNKSGIIQLDSDIVVIAKNVFAKSSPRTVVFAKTGAFTVSTSQQFYVEVAGSVLSFAASTPVTMPGSPTVGQNYAIYATANGLIASANFSAPNGYTTSNSRQIGGFHYAPDTAPVDEATPSTNTPSIESKSFWDLKFRPACDNPRGMVYCDGFWMDIYPLCVNHLTLGTSAYNQTLATGTTPPVMVPMSGGNMDNAPYYDTPTWFDFAEVFRHHGKCFPSVEEFARAATGGESGMSLGGGGALSTTYGTTGLTSPSYPAYRFTSFFGVRMATGCIWIWGKALVMVTQDLTSPSWGWYNQSAVGSGGGIFEYGAGALRAVTLGGNWNNTSNSGSRASNWNNALSSAHVGRGARGVAGHLILE